MHNLRKSEKVTTYLLNTEKRNFRRYHLLHTRTHTHSRTHTYTHTHIYIYMLYCHLCLLSYSLHFRVIL